MKIGENDTIAQWHTKRVSMQSRAPGLYLLDERTRLAGCHMIRDAVERLVLEEGADTVKRFMREAIEDGRRDFKTRVRGMLVPGRYRSVGFTEARYADKVNLPRRAQRDQIMHGAYEAVVDRDGRWTTDLRGASAWGWHSFNATPAAQQGMQWILFTQTLICNDKVNDGAYYATELKLTEGSWADLGDAPCSSSFPWMPMFCTSVGYLRAVSRALQSRGYIEEVVGTYTVPGNVAQGGGIDQYGQISGFMNFEIGAQGQGAKYVLDGLDYGAAVFNPEGDMGDIEMWELVKPMVYLGAPDQAQHRRLGPAPRRLVVRDAAARPRHAGLRDREHRRRRDAHLAGPVRRLPGAERLRPQRLRLRHLRAGGGRRGLPGRRRQRRGPAAQPVRRRAHAQAGPLHDDDRGQDRRPLPLVGPRRRRARRPAAAPRGGDRGGRRRWPPAARYADEGAPTGAPTARAEAARRLERATPAEGVVGRAAPAGPRPGPDRDGEGHVRESMRLEPGWAAEFRGFWDLPEDFDFDVVTPTVVVQRAAPGKVTPEESVRAFLGGSEVYRAADHVEVPVTTQMTKETLADLLDEKLSRRAVKDIQSGIKDPDRFDMWVALLQERVDYDDPIVLPYGEGMNIVRRRSDGELVIRTDAGADLCRWDENWKMHVPMFVRDTDALYEEIYPKLGHPEGDWQELREFYCPVSGRLLETEAVPPGYPVMHEYLPDLTGFYEGWLGRELP